MDCICMGPDGCYVEFGEVYPVLLNPGIDYLLAMLDVPAAEGEICA